MRMDRISEALVMVMLASLPALAQQAGATANENVTATAGGKQLSNSANGGSTANARSGSVRASGSTNAAGGAEMRPVNGELQSKLDSKSAKVGDEVVVKTTQAATTADGTVIPKGSRLVGHVTTVVAHSKESAISQLGIAFDRAELKGGQSLPVHSEIRSLTPPPSVASAGSVDTSMGPGTFGGGGMAGGGMGGARTGSGGGLLGGTVGAVGNSAGAAGSSVGAMANSSLRAPGNVAGDVAGNVGGTVQGVGSVAGNAAANTQARTTGVQGVMLAGDATGTASGMLSASKQNVHLDSGTQMVLGIAAAR